MTSALRRSYRRFAFLRDFTLRSLLLATRRPLCREQRLAGFYRFRIVNPLKVNALKQAEQRTGVHCKRVSQRWNLGKQAGRFLRASCGVRGASSLAGHVRAMPRQRESTSQIAELERASHVRR